MSWRVVREEVEGKRGSVACEDVTVVTDHRFAVIDGATDKSGLTYNLLGKDVTSGYFAASVVAEALRRLPTGTPQDTIRVCSQDLRAAVREQHPSVTAAELPSVSIVAFEPETACLWFCGDAQAGWVNSEGTVNQYQDSKAIDDVTSQFRAAWHAALKAAGNAWNGDGKDPGREAILPLLRMQGALANTPGPYGYPVVNGDEVNPDHVRVLHVPEAVRVVLASDGYPEIAPEGKLSFDDAEARLAHLLQEDPLCVEGLRSTKGLVSGQTSFDDRAWLEVALD